MSQLWLAVMGKLIAAWGSGTDGTPSTAMTKLVLGVTEDVDIRCLV